MSPQQKQYVFLGVLAVVLVGVVAFNFLRKPAAIPAEGGKAAKSAGTNSPSAAAAAKNAPAKRAAAGTKAAQAQEGAGKSSTKPAEVNLDELLAGIKEVDFDYEKERRPRDPLAPLVGTISKAREGKGDEKFASVPTAVQVMNKVVSGIVWDEHRPIAVVDEDVVFPGYEYPDGVVVESIHRDRVVFKVGDSLIENPLKEF